jgi:hypothetical protein
MLVCVLSCVVISFRKSLIGSYTSPQGANAPLLGRRPSGDKERGDSAPLPFLFSPFLFPPENKEWGGELGGNPK